MRSLLTWSTKHYNTRITHIFQILSLLNNFHLFVNCFHVFANNLTSKLCFGYASNQISQFISFSAHNLLLMNIIYRCDDRLNIWFTRKKKQRFLLVCNHFWWKKFITNSNPVWYSSRNTISTRFKKYERVYWLLMIFFLELYCWFWPINSFSTQFRNSSIHFRCNIECLISFIKRNSV